MKHFYAGTFINRDDLKSIGIEYPIKLEYYKTRPNIEVTKNEMETMLICEACYNQIMEQEEE